MKLRTNSIASKYVGAVSGILVVTGLTQVLSPMVIHPPTGVTFWVAWFVRILGIFNLSVGILLFLRPRIFLPFAFCAVAIQIVAGVGVLLGGYPSTSIGYKMLMTLPRIVLALATMLLLVRAKVSDATSCV